MSLRHRSLIAWQRADDLFLKLHSCRVKLPNAPSIADVSVAVVSLFGTSPAAFTASPYLGPRLSRDACE